MTRSPSSAVLGACLALMGCSVVNSPNDHRPGGGEEPVPATGFCAEVAVVICDAVQDCCSMPPSERDACVVEEQNDCNDVIGTILLDPRSGYDGRVANEVLDEMRTFASGCDPDVGEWVDRRAGFARMFRGTVDPGGECTPENLFDAPAYFSCNDLSQACIPNLVRAAWYCTDLRAEGEMCARSDECRDDLYCAEDTCRPTRANGEMCLGPRACTSRVCISGTCSVRTADAVYCALPNAFN